MHIREIVGALRKLGCKVELQEPPGVDAMHACETEATPAIQQGASSFYSRAFKILSQHAPQFVFEVAELGYNLWAWFLLSRRMREGRFEIFYERYAFFSFIGTWLAAWRGIPSVLEVNEISGIERMRGQAMPWLARRIEAAVFKRVDCILVVSNYLKDALVERGVEGGKVHVLPNAVREGVLTSDGPLGEEMRIRLNLQGRTVVGFVGQIARWDRLDLLMEDVAQLLPDMLDLHLLIVGPCPFMEELRQQVERLSLQHAVTLTGPVERADVAAYISIMDICVLPHSNPFGSPIVMFEYMAMGKPVLAVDVGPVRDVIRDEVNGCLFPMGDRGAFRQRLAALVADPALRKRVGTQGNEDVRARHTWGRNAEQVLEIIRDLV